MLRFGYNDGLPKGVRAAWGCRAIVTQDGTVDVPGDRTDAFGPDEARQALLAHLNDAVESKPFDTAAALLKSGEMRTNEAAQFILYASDEVVVKGNTYGSCGYPYICAFRPEDA